MLPGAEPVQVRDELPADGGEDESLCVRADQLGAGQTAHYLHYLHTIYIIYTI